VSQEQDLLPGLLGKELPVTAELLLAFLLLLQAAGYGLTALRVLAEVSKDFLPQVREQLVADLFPTSLL
jgi:hypothetical protein